MAIQFLMRDVQSELRKWSLNTRVYGALYIGIRPGHLDEASRQVAWLHGRP